MNFHRLLYHTLIALGRPIGGMRPRRLYDTLGQKAYPTPDFHWTRDRWGIELFLSHHFHIDRNILIYGDYDHALHQLIEQRIRPGMIALDVGANLGEMSLHLAQKVGTTGTVHAFEPMPAAYDRLVQHIERNKMQDRIHAYATALSNATGPLEMTIPLANADNQGLGSIVNPNISAASQRISIQTTTLDQFRHDRALEKIDFIKLDIQGGEWHFLQGAKQTLADCRPEIVLEISPADLAQINQTSRTLLQSIESLGYRIHHIHKGNSARRIKSSQVPENFAATNVLCLPA